MNQVASARYQERIVLKRPLVTEKSANATAAKNPVYTFLVDGRSNKGEVAKAIKAQFGVKPIKVNVVNYAGKEITVRGRLGKKADYKKALVYLKAGDTINLG